KDVLSYCFVTANEQCVLQFCFALDELEELISSEADPLQVPFPWKEEIERAAASKQLALSVLPVFTPDFVEAVRLRQAERADLAEPLAGFVTALAQRFLHDSPEWLTQGSFVQKAVSWSKRVLKSAAQFVKWLWSNPFWATLITVVAKLLR